MKTLFITTVGSHMWGMQTPESDIDQMLVYQESTRNILEGRPIRNTKPDSAFEQDGIPVDRKCQEIGHLVNKLIDGNVNAIWTVCSPIVVQDHPYLHELRKITEQNLSKASYASINGMAISQTKDHVKRAAVMPAGKSLRTCWRICEFGQMLLLGNEIKFRSVTGDISVSDAEWIIKGLECAYIQSKLPERPDEKPFRDFMFKIRINDLTGLE
jgi:hypothetical protein